MGWGSTPTDGLAEFRWDLVYFDEDGFPKIQKKLNDFLEPRRTPQPESGDERERDPYRVDCEDLWVTFEEKPEELDRRRRKITNVAYRFLTAFAYCRLLAKKIEEEGVNVNLFHDSCDDPPALWGQVADSVRTILERSRTSKEELREEIEAIQPNGFWEAEYRGLSFMEAEDEEVYYEKHNKELKAMKATRERLQLELDKWHQNKLVQQEKMEKERMQEETRKSRAQEELDQLPRQSVEVEDEQHGERRREMLQLQQLPESPQEETPRPSHISLGPWQPMRVQKHMKKGKSAKGKTQPRQQRHETKQSTTQDNATRKSSSKIMGTRNNSIMGESCTPAATNGTSKVSRIMDGLSTDAIIGDSSSGRSLRNTRARQATVANSSSRTNTGVLSERVDSKVSKHNLKPRRQVTRSKARVP